MNKNIFCAIDLEHPSISKKILSEGLRLADANGATVNVMTVIPDYGMTIVGSYFEEGVQAKAIASTNDALHAFVSENLTGNVKIRHIVSSGSVYEEVLKYADQVEADVIVIGASKPDLKDFLLGPNAARVARHANVSVFIVRE